MSSGFLGALAGLGGGLLFGWPAVVLARSRPGRAWVSRKLFHVGIFTAAVVVHLAWGAGGILGFGVGVSVVLGVAVLEGWGGKRLLGALAREGEGSKRWSVLLPWAATAVGGLVNLLLLGSWAVVGYAVCGWGDAAGEWVGRRWGRHTWKDRAPRLPAAPQKTIEGSLAVWVAGALGAWVALALLGEGWAWAWAAGVLAAGAGALAEAMSRGPDDNLWVQVVPAVTAWLLCS